MARVLIVDDEKSVRITLREFLKEDKHEISVAKSADEALRLVEKLDFDIIISDIILPRINGMILLKQIRETSPDIQVIMITGEPTADTAARAVRAGAFDYLAKPVSAELLKKAVKNAAKVKDLKDENRRYQEHLEELVEERAKALSESEKKYRTLVENVNIGIYRINVGENVKFIEVNPAIINMFGCKSREELLSINVPDLYQNPNNWRKLSEHILKDGSIRNVEFKFMKRDGTSFIGSQSVVVFKDKNEDVLYFDGVIENISELKQIESKLHRFSKVIQDSSDAIIIYDFNGQIIAWDYGAEVIYGWNEDEALKMNIKKLIPLEKLDRTNNFIEKLMKGKTVEPFVTERISKDGRLLYIWLTFTLLKDEEGKPYAVATTEQDITKRKIAEKGLLESEEGYRNLIESLGEGIIVANLENKIVIANPAAERIFDVNPGKLIDRKLDEFVDAKNLTILKNQKLFKKSKWNNYEIEIIQPGGRRRLLNITVTPKFDKDLNTIGMLGVFRDITEIKRMEEDILKTDKLESIGILASGIAHDFNNILTVILGNITLAKMFLEPENKVYNRLEGAEKASLRAKDLTQQLLTFSKGGSPVKKISSISDLLTESVNFSLTGSQIKCEFFINDQLWPVEIDEGQISQVINNLMINAVQAMPDGGIIKVGAENVNIFSDNSLPLNEGKYVKVTVEDNGTGISKENLQKIFDPYFTTKEKGNGLGLSTSFSIIKKHDGFIDVESELGKGTTFNIYLPASLKKKLVSGMEEEIHTVETGKILVVDDDEEIRELAELMLDKIGYDVEISKDGYEAIEMYKKSMEVGKPFDAIIMDLTIPGGMGGKEAVSKLIKIDPDVKAVISSGYSNNPIMSDYRKYGFAGVITKPYRAEELNRILTELLRDGR